MQHSVYNTMPIGVKQSCKKWFKVPRAYLLDFNCSWEITPGPTLLLKFLVFLSSSKLNLRVAPYASHYTSMILCFPPNLTNLNQRLWSQCAWENQKIDDVTKYHSAKLQQNVIKLIRWLLSLHVSSFNPRSIRQEWEFTLYNTFKDEM